MICTLPELAEILRRSIKAMTPEEKAACRQALEQSFRPRKTPAGDWIN
jgi:hypothetical protein